MDTVAPKIISSDIDRWLAQARAVRPGTPQAFSHMVAVHGEVTALFTRISDLEKRSLASKYLHFHVPRLFFIYDSRDVQALRSLGPLLPRASRNTGAGDNEYRKFAEKCTHLARHCSDVFDAELTPRQLDNLLLRLSAR